MARRRAPLRATPSIPPASSRLETKFRALPDPAAMRAYMQRLSARPHHVGLAYDKDNAEWIAAKPKSGASTPHRNLRRPLPTPKERLLEMTAPTRYLAKIAEPPGQHRSHQQSAERTAPRLQRLSIDGDVTAPMVYVNSESPRLRGARPPRISVKGPSSSRATRVLGGIKPRSPPSTARSAA